MLKLVPSAHKTFKYSSCNSSLPPRLLISKNPLKQCYQVETKHSNSFNHLDSKKQGHIRGIMVSSNSQLDRIRNHQRKCLLGKFEKNHLNYANCCWMTILIVGLSEAANSARYKIENNWVLPCIHCPFLLRRCHNCLFQAPTALVSPLWWTVP